MFAAGYKRQTRDSSHPNQEAEELPAKRQRTSKRTQNSQPSVASADFAQGAANAINGKVMGEFYPSAREMRNARQPHGLMAERANHCTDKMARQSDCRHIGSSNIRDGPDRIVNGVQIQSKYCATPEKTLGAFFKKGGELRYLGEKTSLPMDMEVPADQYDVIVRRFEKQIAAGKVKVSGKVLTEPQYAKKLIRKGHYTYASTRAMAKAGTLESAKYDVQTGAMASVVAGGIAAATTLATGNWKDGEGKDTCKKAAVAGGCSAARATGTHVATCQVTRLGVPCAGAAVAVNAAVTVVGTSYDLCRGNISTIQAERNVLKSGAGLVGGKVGASVGAAVGTAILPGVGTLIGAAVGATVSGIGAGFAADMVSDGVLGVSDSAFVQSVYHKVVLELQSQYGLSEYRVAKLRSMLETEAMHQVLIKDRDFAFYKALTAGQQILRARAWAQED